jgi:hypothetical protein
LWTGPYCNVGMKEGENEESERGEGDSEQGSETVLVQIRPREQETMEDIAKRFDFYFM